jgi:Skp family chaperone for outer membrane proteins
MFKSLALVSSFALSISAFAGGFGSVDIQKIEGAAKPVMEFRKEIESHKNKYQEGIKKMEAEITKETETLKSKASIWSSDKLKDEEKKIQMKIEKYTKEVQADNATLELVMSYGVNDLNSCMSESIAEVAKKHELDAVFPLLTMLYRSEKVTDITHDVVSNLDKRKCKVDTKAYFKKAKEAVEKGGK